MQSMRRNMKTIMLVVAVSFVVGFVYLQLGQGGLKGQSRRNREAGIIGRVNGRPIRADYFRYRVGQAWEQALAEKGVRNLPDDEVMIVEEETWHRIIEEMILDKEVRRRRIIVTDRELVGAIRSNPPPAILYNEAFRLEDGSFDFARYNQLLANPQAAPWLRQYEADLRTALPRQKLMIDFFAAVQVSDADVREAYREEHEQFDLSYIRVDPREMEGTVPEPTDEELAACYAENKGMFGKPELVRLNFVKVVREPSDADILVAKEEIEQIHEELLDGADFAQLAQERSDDPTSAARGGDLGMVQRGQMVPQFEEIAFSLKPGEFSEPFRTRYGWHIIKIDVKRRDEIKARHILIKPRPSWETLAALEETARSFWMDAHELGFEEAIEAHGLKLMKTDEFPRGIIPIGIEPILKDLVNDFGFEHAIGEISPIFAGRDSYFVCQVDEKFPAYTPSLEELRPQMEGLVRGEKKMEQAFEKAERVTEGLAEGRSLEQVAAAEGLEVYETSLVTRSTYIRGVPPRTQVQGAAFTLEAGEVRGPVPTNIGYFFIRCNEKIPMNEETFESERMMLKARLRQERGHDTYDSWLQEQRKAARIEDYRRVIEVS